MSIAYAMLAMLHHCPLSGYDMKKAMQRSPYMPWSGNNNQIYKALVGLSQEGLVSSVVRPGDSAPSKKVYSITERGRAALRQWLLSPPEPPAFKNPFLIRLSAASALSDEELRAMVDRYEAEVRAQTLMLQEQYAREEAPPNRTEREAVLAEAMRDNALSALLRELEWIGALRRRFGFDQYH